MKKYSIYTVTGIILIFLIVVVGVFFIVDYDKIPEEGKEDIMKVAPKMTSVEGMIWFFNDLFEIVERNDNIPLSPEDFFDRKSGGDIDFSFYISGELSEGGYENEIIRYKTEMQEINTIVVFEDRLTLNYIYVDDEAIKMKRGLDSLDDVLKHEEERLNLDIALFKSFESGTFDLTPSSWVGR